MSPLQDNQDGYDIAWIEHQTDLQDESNPSFEGSASGQYGLGVRTS